MSPVEPTSLGLSVNNLSYAVAGETILSNISFNLQPGKINCLLGPSGCGKTTLLKLLSGLLIPASGNITLDGEDITLTSYRSRGDHHPVMMVFQDLGLFPHMSIAENIGYGLTMGNKQKRKIIKGILTQFNLDHYYKHYPHELSGGEQQRIALARALVLDPRVLLLDEPFANLDTATRLPLAQEVLSLLKKRNIITLLVTHEREIALSLADYTGVMDSKKILQFSDPSELVVSPNCPQVAMITGHNSIINGVFKDSETVDTALGAVKAYNKIDLSDGVKHCDVLVRVGDCRINNQRQGVRVKIIFRNFEAGELIYTLRLENDEEVVVLGNNLANLKIGDEVYVELINRELMIYQPENIN